MGTNYYISCKTCRRPIYHIGKQSAGWDFKSNLTKEELKNFKLKKNEAIMSGDGEILTLDKLFKETTKNWEIHEDGEKWFKAGDDGWC